MASRAAGAKSSATGKGASKCAPGAQDFRCSVRGLALRFCPRRSCGALGRLPSGDGCRLSTQYTCGQRLTVTGFYAPRVDQRSAYDILEMLVDRSIEARKVLGGGSEPEDFVTARRLAREQVRREVGVARWNAYCSWEARAAARGGKGLGRAGRRRQHDLDDLATDLGLSSQRAGEPVGPGGDVDGGS
jgi:hypothetical protein